ncbi:hypothetical protein PVAND_011842 [Polypedilum vanderplanki]|uniref:Apolipophorin-III n=1 Tax=Polypedilum vanderplanki TaxID=319348 RepID=A0A9J6CLG5_POLVA|nr:hypothetical protein PVAND_011842 [Polypedilum vanderplanki]
MCLFQIAISAPAEKSLAEQAQETIANVQKQAQDAVQQFNVKVLETVGVRNNEELVNTVQTRAQTYATQIKGVADQISAQAAQNKGQIDGVVQNIAKQISDSAAKILGNDDPAKVDQLQKTFTNVLDQANTLNTRLGEEGTSLQAIFNDALAKLYDNTINTAKSLAQQLDAAKKN